MPGFFEDVDVLYPLRFQPILKRLIWGGRRLGTVLGKPIGPEPDYAESWELSDHGGDVSAVAEGPLAGRTLRELIAEFGPDLLGPALAGAKQFPLLVKFLDANQVLSVQVHPNDELGRKLVNDSGKTEAWVVLHAEPDSVIYAGLNAGVTYGQFEAALQSNAIEPLLHRFNPRAGDCVLIPAGTVHAIGAGILLAEIQQMSDATFRVFDWGRVGPDGQPRKLHISESLKSIDFAAGPVGAIVPEVEVIPGGAIEHLTRCPYFVLERLRWTGTVEVGTPERFTILLGLAGRAVVRHAEVEYDLEEGQTLLLPASLAACNMINHSEASVLTCVVP